MHLLSDSRKGTLEPIEHEDLPDAVDAEGDEGEDAPDGVGGDEDVAGPQDGQQRRRGDLADGVGHDEGRRHVVVVLALEPQVLAHAADVGRAVARPVDPEQEPDQREVDQQRRV